MKMLKISSVIRAANEPTTTNFTVRAMRGERAVLKLAPQPSRDSGGNRSVKRLIASVRHMSDILCNRAKRNLVSMAAANSDLGIDLDPSDQLRESADMGRPYGQ